MDLRKQKIIATSLGIAIVAGIFGLLANPRHKVAPGLREFLTSRELTRYREDLVPADLSRAKKPDNVAAAPRLSVQNYTLTTPLPRPIDATTIYTFKTFSREEAISLAKKLTGEDAQSKESGREIILQNSQDKKQVIIDPATGMFSYRSQNPKTTLAITPGSNPAGVVARYLKNLGLIDDTVAATAYYRRQKTPGLIYIEFHRLWEHVGAPIVNTAGILNTPANLDNLSLTAFDPGDPRDKDVTGTSDDADGFARRNEFNSLTATVSDDGRLLSIYSTLRPLSERQSLSELGLKLLNPADIISSLASGSFFTYLLPKGEEKATWQELFAGNKVNLAEAKIASVILAYQEKPLGVGQQFLLPVYVVRGEGKTDDGKVVAFTQTIPAVVPAKVSVGLGTAFAQEPTGGTLQFGTFEPTGAVTLAPQIPANLLPTLPDSIGVSLKNQDTNCQAIDHTTSTRYNPTDRFFVEGVGTLVLFRNVPKIANRTFFLTPVPNLTETALGFQKTIDGLEITSPCVIMPTT